ncbi:MAG: ribonuclease H-like YkuK family protein [Parcubacteria group bacterium]|nr:ribonuclease H-like YkuK family protein [Parcubacteria group bacterium]
MQYAFRDASGSQLTISQVVGEVLGFMHASESARYKITVGTDSLLAADHSADFVTAIVVHRVGNGGRYFWRRIELDKFHTLRDRIIREVLLSLEIAKALLEVLRNVDAPSFDFEIHADIGEKGETRAVMQEVLGMIRAYNFEAKTKPDSYAATKVADRHV